VLFRVDPVIDVALAAWAVRAGRAAWGDDCY